MPALFVWRVWSFVVHWSADPGKCALGGIGGRSARIERCHAYGAGHTTYLSSNEDIHGAVTINLNDVYARRVAGKKDYEGYGSLRRADAFEASGIRGQRAVAIDFSSLIPIMKRQATKHTLSSPC